MPDSDQEPTAASARSAKSSKPAKKAAEAPEQVAAPQQITEAQAAFEREGTGKIDHKPRDERIAEGLLARAKVPPKQLGDYAPGADRAHPVELILSQEASRLQHLLPIRHARMAQSPFAFYRGSAILMAQDLGANPSPLLPSQIGGDAHMSNFGFYAGEDRRLVFDMNDFDETAPGPFEWDVKRYAASILLAARANNIPEELAQQTVLVFARRYAWWLKEFAKSPSLSVWYDRLDVEAWIETMRTVPIRDLENLILALEGGVDSGATEPILTQAAEQAAADRLKALGKKAPKETKKAKDKARKDKGSTGSSLEQEAEMLRAFYVAGGENILRRARKKTGLQAVSSLTVIDSNGRRRFVDQPPLVERISSDGLADAAARDAGEQIAVLRHLFRQYRASLAEEKRVLVDRYAYRDAALKVVGVGSVGTRAAVLLMEGQGDDDPFILQIKEASQSVVTQYLPAGFKAAHLPLPANMGKRVVLGQRLMQSTSDLFLGWVSFTAQGTEAPSDYYVRQLKDMKLSFDVEEMDVATLMINAILVARVLCSAHARSGDPLTLAAYVGDDDSFAQGILAFSLKYQDQVNADYEEFMGAIARGDVEVSKSVDG